MAIALDSTPTEQQKLDWFAPEFHKDVRIKWFVKNL
jgi:hypothetical protein